MGIRLSAQVQFARGQNVAPAFEGWEHNPDGTYSLVFGYLNRNYEEEVDIPLGSENSITIGSEVYGDKGQPTHFYPRRQRFLFRVVVPADWDKKQKVVWTLTSRGRTDQAKGWLQPEWELSQDVIVENMGGGVPDPNNRAPVVTVDPAQTVALPNPATLIATATDDGLPKPYRRAPFESGPRCTAEASDRRPDQVDSIPGSRQGDVRSGFEPGGARGTRHTHDQGDVQRTRHIRSSRDCERWAIVHLPRCDRDRNALTIPLDETKHG